MKSWKIERILLKLVLHGKNRGFLFAVIYHTSQKLFQPTLYFLWKLYKNWINELHKGSEYANK